MAGKWQAGIFIFDKERESWAVYRLLDKDKPPNQENLEIYGKPTLTESQAHKQASKLNQTEK